MKRVKTTNEIAWREIAMLFPEFVQWVAQKYGPLTEMVNRADYTKYRTEYTAQFNNKETSTNE